MHLHTHFSSIHRKQIFPRCQFRAGWLSACINTPLMCIFNIVCRNQTNVRAGVSTRGRKPHKQPSSLYLTLSPSWVNTTWVSKTTFLLDHCHKRWLWSCYRGQLPSPFSSWGVALHTTTDQSYRNRSLQPKAAFGSLFPAFSNFLTLDSPHQCQQALPRRLSIHIGFNTTLKRKISPTMHVCLSERTSVLVCKHVWSQEPRSQWKYAATGNMLQACLERKARPWWGARTELSTWASTGSLGVNSQVITWPAMEALYPWGCCYKLRNMQLWKGINFFVFF